MLIISRLGYDLKLYLSQTTSRDTIQMYLIVHRSIMLIMSRVR